MELGNNAGYQRTILKVNYPSFNRMVDLHNKLRNISFDHNFIVTQSSSGLNVGLNISAITATLSDNPHFWLENNSSSSTPGSDFICRGGIWNRDSHDDNYEAKLVCDNGNAWSEDYTTDYKSFSIPANSVRYVYIKLDDPMVPTEVTLATSASWPAYDPDTDFVVIGRCNSYSGVCEQYYDGDVNDSYERPDGEDSDDALNSIERNDASGNLQLYDFDTASDEYCIEVANVGGIIQIIYQTTNQTPSSCDTTASNAGTFATGLSRGDHTHKITDSEHSNYSDIATYANTGPWISTFYHGAYGSIGNVLYDIQQGTAPDGHDSLSTTTGNYPYISGRGINREGNKFLSTASIDDTDGHESIIPNERTLNVDDSDVTINWGCCYAYTLSSQICIKWDTQELTSNNSRDLCWAVATHELTNSWSCTKTFNAKKYEMSDDAANDYWSATNFKVTSTNLVDIYATNGLTIGAQAVRQIVLGADINLVTGTLKINNTPGVSMTGYSVIDNIGNLHPIATTSGLLTTG